MPVGYLTNGTQFLLSSNLNPDSVFATEKYSAADDRNWLYYLKNSLTGETELNAQMLQAIVFQIEGHFLFSSGLWLDIIL